MEMRKNSKALFLFDSPLLGDAEWPLQRWTPCICVFAQILTPAQLGPKELIQYKNECWSSWGKEPRFKSHFCEIGILVPYCEKWWIVWVAFYKEAEKVISEKKQRKLRKGKTKMYPDIIIEFGGGKKKKKRELDVKNPKRHQ